MPGCIAHPAAPQIDAASRNKLHHEGLWHLENLKAGGALGVARPVRISGTGAFSEGAVLRPLANGEKRVHLIRHGQGFHNLLADIYKQFGQQFNGATGEGGACNPYSLPEVLDPPLTEIGRNQARALQPVARSLAAELIVVSPLVRATQTALIAFAHLVEGANSKVPFLAHEGCREISGVHVCDKRQSATELRRDFPMVDYTTMSIMDEDPTWKIDEREKPLELASRGYDFLLWLRSRPESDIVVATHSAWLFALLNAVIDCDDDALKGWFATGEIRSLVLRFEDCKDELDAKRSRTG